MTQLIPLAFIAALFIGTIVLIPADARIEAPAVSRIPSTHESIHALRPDYDPLGAALAARRSSAPVATVVPGDPAPNVAHAATVPPADGASDHQAPRAVIVEDHLAAMNDRR